MNKEFLVELLKKDIHELELLTQGFEKMTDFPEPILDLAKQKAEAVLESLDELANLNKNTETQLVDEPVVTPSVKESVEIKEPVVTEEDIKLKPVVEVVEADVQSVENISNNGFNDAKPKEKIVLDKVYSEPEKVVEEVKEVIEPEIIEKKAEAVIEEDETPDNLSSVNDNVKVSDIKNAINIGDRFRFQRELFGGNGEVMNKTIAYLNQLSKYDEAVSFLKNKFGWDKKNQHAEDFYKIIRRRYL